MWKYRELACPLLPSSKKRRYHREWIHKYSLFFIPSLLAHTLHVETAQNERRQREEKDKVDTSQWVSLWTAQANGCKLIHVQTPQGLILQSRLRQSCFSCTIRRAWDTFWPWGYKAQHFRMTPFPTAHRDMTFLHSSAVWNAKIRAAWGLSPKAASLGCHAEGWHKNAGVAGVVLGLPQAQGPQPGQAPSLMSKPPKTTQELSSPCGRAFSAALGLTYSKRKRK